MGNSHQRPRLPDVCDPTRVKLVARSGPNDDEVIIRFLGPVLATSRSFDCNDGGEEKEACRKEALRAAQAQCSLLGGNCILEAEADVTAALDDGAGPQAKDCYIVSGTVCILRRKADVAKASESSARNDGRIREGPTKKQKPQEPPAQERRAGSRKADHRIRDGPASQDRGGAVRAAGGLVLSVVDEFDADVNWNFD